MRPRCCSSESSLRFAASAAKVRTSESNSRCGGILSSLVKVILAQEFEVPVRDACAHASIRPRRRLAAAAPAILRQPVRVHSQSRIELGRLERNARSADRDGDDSIAALRAPELRSPYIQSIAVARRGRLVLDRYFYRFSAAQPHDVGRYRHRGRSRDPLTARAASRA